MSTLKVAAMICFVVVPSLASEPNVVAWGDNARQQTNVPASLTNAVAISADENKTFALTDAGQVIKWGDGAAAVTFPGSDYIDISALGSLALRSDGTVVRLNYDGKFENLTQESGLVKVAGAGFGVWETLNANGDFAAHSLDGPLFLTNIVDIFDAPLTLFSLKAESALIRFGLGNSPTTGFRSLPGIPDVVTLIYDDLNMTVYLDRDGSLRALPENLEKYLTAPAFALGGV